MQSNKHGTSWRFHLSCCLSYSFLCMAWRWFAGPNLSSDHVHYHLYVAHAWWQGRLPEELFAAGTQSYLNPLPHLPFYALFQTGAHSLVIGLGIALLHSVNLWLTHFISCHLISSTGDTRKTAIVCATLLG